MLKADRTIRATALGLSLGAVLCLGMGLSLLTTSASAQTTDVHLFKLITVKDEITIGLSAQEATQLGLGSGPVLDALARKLVSQGQMTVWQYAVRKAGDGSLEQAPLRRLAIFKHDSLRLEPYNPAPLKAVAPAN